MAQSIQDIQSEIITEKANHPELAPLNSSSSTSIWRLWMFVTATIIYYFETILDLFKVDVQNLLNNNIYGTNTWWLTQLYNFQFGDTLLFIDNVFKYANVDNNANSTKKIIKFASITTVNGVVQIKVAGSNGGVPSQLTQTQLDGVISYCNQIQPTGIRFAVQSLNADILKLNANIYYDASADLTLIQPAVEAAINSFLVTKNTANFNGVLYINSLIDAIQAVPGLVGNKVDITYIAAKDGTNPYVQFNSSYQPQSGYFIIDSASPLSSSIIYKPYFAQ